jgi:hypothetical protein
MEHQDKQKEEPGEVRPFDALVIPPLNNELKTILGMPNFKCGSISGNLRDRGHEIPKKAEEEQAYVIHFMLHLYEKHGSSWRIKFAESLREKAV